MPHFEKRPPRLVGGTLSDKLSLVKLGWDIRRLGRDEMRELMRIGAINIYDVLQERFESELLKGAIGLDATLGTHLGPRSPNSVLTYLYRMTGQVQGRQGALALAKGGMGSVTAALASAAEDRGVSIRTGAPVAHISVQEGRLTGVQLESGEFVPAPVVSSSADPKRTLLGLLGAQHLETGFVRRVTNLRMQGNAAKLHLALEDLPHFSGLSQKESGGRLVIAPNLNYLERAFDHAKYGQYSPAPALEITIPTLHEQTLAPDCKHVLSAVVQYAPYRLKQGWNAGREKFQQLVIDRIAEYAPSLKEMIVASELLTPEDIEREFLITGGHWHHGELTLDQFMMLRPVPGAAQYSTPIPGLYLCGAGSHPGGGVMGLAGRNAAHEISSNGPGEGEV
jgi:phytoene dehydrogenase-like protein